MNSRSEKISKQMKRFSTDKYRRLRWRAQGVGGGLRGLGRQIDGSLTYRRAAPLSASSSAIRLTAVAASAQNWRRDGLATGRRDVG
jgi:hypothetical protein